MSDVLLITSGPLGRRSIDLIRYAPVGQTITVKSLPPSIQGRKVSHVAVDDLSDNGGSAMTVANHDD
jgi:hypothetical protein